jgi:hypothetical protein
MGGLLFMAVESGAAGAFDAAMISDLSGDDSVTKASVTRWVEIWGKKCFKLVYSSM